MYFAESLRTALFKEYRNLLEFEFFPVLRANSPMSPLIIFISFPQIHHWHSSLWLESSLSLHLHCCVKYAKGKKDRKRQENEWQWAWGDSSMTVRILGCTMLTDGRNSNKFSQCLKVNFFVIFTQLIWWRVWVSFCSSCLFYPHSLLFLSLTKVDIILTIYEYDTN